MPLTGDASDRRYFRIIRPDGVSIVLALHAGPIAFASLPFANVAELLRRLPLPVPAILGHSDALGILALEDLGDVTLQAHLGAARLDGTRRPLPPGDRAHRNRFNAAARSWSDDAYIPYRIAFDVDKLTWELDFFAKHFIEGFRGAALSDAGAQRRSTESSRRSPMSSPPSRGCSATATITAAI